MSLNFYLIRNLPFASYNHPNPPADIHLLSATDPPPSPVINPDTLTLGRPNVADICCSYILSAPYLSWLDHSVDAVRSSAVCAEFHYLMADAPSPEWITDRRNLKRGPVSLREDIRQSLLKAQQVILEAAALMLEVAHRRSWRKLYFSSLPVYVPEVPSSFVSYKEITAWLHLTCAKTRLYLAWFEWFHQTYASQKPDLPSHFPPTSRFYSRSRRDQTSKMGCV
ncbi:hypothetical protein SISSUDRAFT_1067439 [Sistotremastrum suecicum HHB10207 ss-3]|uniref:Uncharacterized protein n=1 Tax=Sistotremastrum suecicum HHB10207 ss-3 TaxID=1314776 RepID=A0A165X4H1_9AGAM|nr:hypothetical protein SISSUDRAFT_1067439 [Sistotremastrum suecicum HHB10207 ss-3]